MTRSRYGRRALLPYSEALTAAQRSAKAPQPYCSDRPDEYVDYDEDSIPSEEEAAAMCAPCPLRDLCLDNARRTQPGWGVWGGVAWVERRWWHLATAEEKSSIISSLKS